MWGERGSGTRAAASCWRRVSLSRRSASAWTEEAAASADSCAIVRRVSAIVSFSASSSSDTRPSSRSCRPPPLTLRLVSARLTQLRHR
eukprot:2936348-Rhodomonas_salina.1